MSNLNSLYCNLNQIPLIFVFSVRDKLNQDNQERLSTCLCIFKLPSIHFPMDKSKIVIKKHFFILDSF